MTMDQRTLHREVARGAGGTPRDGVEDRARLVSRRRPIVIIAGAIAPYTNRIYDAYGAEHQDALSVLTCVDVEPQRKWQMPVARHYDLQVLPGLRVHRSDLRNIYINPAVISRLNRIRPRAILIGAFSPTMVMAAQYAFATGTPFGVMTDGSVEMDPGNTSRIHRWMRRSLIPRARLGIGASRNSLLLLQSYGLAAERTRDVPIVCPWPAPAEVPGFDERPFDVLFCGAIEEQRKGAQFLADVVLAAHGAGRTLRVRFAGDGPLRTAIQSQLEAAGVPAQFDGYVQPAQLPEIYASAKVFAFPSRGDPWGLVVNEAMQCGTPVVGSPHGVSSLELVAPYDGGNVLPLEVPAWRDAILRLLDDRAYWQHCHAARVRAATRLSLGFAVSELQRAFELLHD